MASKELPFKNLELRVKARMEASVKEAAEAVYQKVVENASLTDHTLDALQKLGHPYAVRNPRPLHGTQVHAQSGNLRDSIKLEKVSELHYIIKIDPAKVPYIDSVIYGTRYMVARDFITASFNEMKPKLYQILIGQFKTLFHERVENLKTQYRNVRDLFANG